MIFTGTVDRTQKFKLFQTSIKTEDLKCIISRDKTWYDSKPQCWTDMLNSIAESINTEGLRNPLSVLYNNGQYEIHCGGQRYAACTKLGIRTIRCIAAFKEKDWRYIPEGLGTDIGSPEELKEMFSSPIDKIHLANNCFEILVKDRINYDPNTMEIK